MSIAIIAITSNGAGIGKTLKNAIPDSTLFVIDKHARGEAEAFSCGLPALVSRLWPACKGFIFVMATGIVVRTIAPLVQAKDKDPAVVVLDDGGRFAISLLSGHIGGANALASYCANLTGAVPVITTATDVNNLPSFDMLAKELGWGIEELSRVKVLNALLLEGKAIAVVDHGDAIRNYCGGRGRLTFHDDIVAAIDSGADGFVVATNRLIPEHLLDERLLVLRPRNLCVGIGCNRGTTSDEIDCVVKSTLQRLSFSLRSVRSIATAEAKRDEEGLVAFAREAGIPVEFYGSGELNGVAAPSPPSEHAFAAIGAKGVAEPAAILASGGGRIVVEKIKDGNVTLAIAEAV